MSFKFVFLVSVYLSPHFDLSYRSTSDRFSIAVINLAGVRYFYK